MWTLLPIEPAFARKLLNSAKDGLGYRQAGLGQHAQKLTALRSDSIRWVERTQGSTETDLLNRLEELQQQLQDYFRISLKKVESHFSVYEPGQFYVRHRDTAAASVDGTARIFSFVIYLNPDWKNGDGGELRGYSGDNVLFQIEPHLGSMILFRSDVEHEVLPAHRTRYALTGWFRK